MADLRYGVASVWDTDHDVQRACLEAVVSDIRHIEDPEIQKLQADYLERLGAFYVFSGEYLIQHFGKSIMDLRQGIFSPFNTCYLHRRLAIPIRFADGTVIGFIGYSNKPKDWPADRAWIKYSYPGSQVFSKGRYFFIEPDEIKKAIQDQYVCIVDGLFDKIILQCLGINAVSLCGSSLTDWHVRYLSLIKHKIVVADNDVAGRKLFNLCKWKMDNVVEIRQPYTGDIDDFLKSQDHLAAFLKVFSEMQDEGFIIPKEVCISEREEKAQS